jgi:Flp pilus assembly protein TadB
VTPLLFGAAAGIGLVMVASVVVPPRPDLARTLQAVNPPTVSAAPTADQQARWGWEGIGRRLLPLLSALGLPRPALAADLALCGRSPQRHAAEQACAVLTGLAVPNLAAAAAWAAGAPLSWTLPLWTSLAAAVAAGIAVQRRVRRAAGRRRHELRHAACGLLELAAVGLAGGAGVEQALVDAAETGHGWAHQRLRQAITAARTARLPIWQPLTDLATGTDLPELAELAAAFELAGAEGARIREHLSTHAAALRQRQVTDVETTAAAATERMALPTGLLLVGFLLLLGYPALATILTGH